MSNAFITLHLLLDDGLSPGFALFGSSLLSTASNLTHMKSALYDASNGTDVLRQSTTSITRDIQALEGGERVLTTTVQNYGDRLVTTRRIQDSFRDGTVQVSQTVDEQRLAVSAADQEFMNLGVTLKGATAAAMAGAGLDFLAFSSTLLKGVEAAGNLEYAMAQLSMRLQGASDVIPQLTAQIADIAAHSLYAKTEIADMFTTLGTMGFTAQQVMQGVGQQVVYLAEVTGVNLNDAARLVGSTMHIFANQNLDAKTAVKDLTGAILFGIPNISELQSGLDQAGGVAATLGVKLNDLTSVMAILTRAGLTTTQAGTGLRYMMTNLVNPTIKAAKELQALGVTSTDMTAPALLKLEGQLKASGKAGRKAVDDFDSSATGLMDLYSAAQKLGLVSKDVPFNVWAAQSHILNNELFDSKGNFKGLQAAVDDLKNTVKGKTTQEALAILSNLFNIKSGQAAELLTALQSFDTQYAAAQDRIKNTSPEEKAKQMLDTLKGSWKELQTTIDTFMALSFGPMIDGFTHINQHLNDFIGFMQKHQIVTDFFSTFITAGVILSGFAVILGGLAIVIATGFAPVLLIFLAVAAAIAGIAAAFAAVKAAWDAAVKWIKNVIDSHKDLKEIVQKVKDKLHEFKQKWDDIVKGFDYFYHTIWLAEIKPAWEGFKDELEKHVIPQVVKLWNAISPFLPHLKLLAEFILGVLVIALTIFAGALRLLTGVLIIATAAIKTLEGWLHQLRMALMNAIMSAMQFAAGMRSAWNQTVATVGAAVGEIGALITRLPGFKWGADLVHSIANGIRSALPSIFSAAGSVAGAIAGLLHHSTPDTGPLKGDDKWGFEFATNLASGMRAGVPHVSSAALALASGMAFSPSSAASGMSTAATAAGVQVNVYLDSEQIAAKVDKRITKQMRGYGSSRVMH